MNRTHIDISEMADFGTYTFSVPSRVAITLVCTCIIVVLFIGARAIVFATKLPYPFKMACKGLLGTDIVLALVTGLEPWLSSYFAYDIEVTSVSALLVTLATTLLSLERAAAFKIPLKYIRFSGHENRTAAILVSAAFAMILMLYISARVSCILLVYTEDEFECLHQRRYFIHSTTGIFILLTSMFLAVVLKTIRRNRKQCTRRNTRMGLPQNHAISSTDNHLTATLFLVYPCAVAVAISCMILPFCLFMVDKMIMITISLVFRVLFLVVHGIIFNAWFDESRLHLLTLLSPFSASFQLRADQMRIDVYNIVISRALHSDRFSTSSSTADEICSRRNRFSWAPQRRSDNNVRVSSVSVALSSRSASQRSLTAVYETYPRIQLTQLENISETEA